MDGGANQVPTYLGQSIHLYSPLWFSLAIITSNHCNSGVCTICRFPYRLVESEIAHLKAKTEEAKEKSLKMSESFPISRWAAEIDEEQAVVVVIVVVVIVAVVVVVVAVVVKMIGKQSNPFHYSVTVNSEGILSVLNDFIARPAHQFSGHRFYKQNFA